MIIYEPRGKAREFAALAANLYKGCTHGCRYCYAPAATFTPRDQFTGCVSIRKGWADQIERDCAKLSSIGCKDMILMSFTTDPYQPAEEKFMVTRRAMEIISGHRLSVGVLTKGGKIARRDLDILSRNPQNQFACTLTTDIDEESSYWEPGAALPGDRVENLKKAYEKAIDTWVSFEPVVNPEAVLRLIDTTHWFVNLYKIGKLNYHKKSKDIDWRTYLNRVEEKLSAYGKKWIVKKDLEIFR